MRIAQPHLNRARFEIIPMIDTIFFLLVFFMIAWLSMVKMNGLPLTLPRENRTSGKPPASIVLSVAPSGVTYLDGRAIGQSEWPASLRTRLLAHPDGVIVINVAPAQKTQTLISLIDSVNNIVTATHARAQILVATRRVTAVKTPDAGAHEVPYGDR